MRTAPAFTTTSFMWDGRVTYDWGRSTDTFFYDNVFFGNHVQPPADTHAITDRPPLAKPGSGGDGLSSLKGYRLRHPDDFPTGLVVPNNGSRDFFGAPVPPDRPPDIGAAQR